MSNADKDAAWELVQMKGLTAWANRYLDPANKIGDMTRDLMDGVKLCLLTEGLKAQVPDLQTVKIGNWTRKPMQRIQKIENCNVALNFLKNQLKVKVTADAVDFVGSYDSESSNRKMVLGLMWITFRRTMGFEELPPDKEMEALLNWVKETTAGYKGVEIKTMKDSWKDGLAFNALLHKAGVQFDYNALVGKDPIENLKHAFDLAEKSFALPQLLEPADLVKCAADDRSVMFYLNLMRHAMKEELEKRKLAGGLQSLEQQLASEREARRAAEEELARLRAELEALKNSLRELESKYKLDSQLYMDEKTKYEEQMQKLQKLLTEEQDTGSKQDEELKRLRQQLEEAQRARSELEERTRKLAEKGGDLGAQLNESEERRRKVEGELDECRKQLAAETERRKRQGQAAEEMERELARLRQEALNAELARAGLDVLKRGLVEHLEDMYKWRELTSNDEEVLKQVFDLQSYLGGLQGKKFSEQLTVLGGSLHKENETVRKMLKLADDKMDLNDQFIRSGWAEIKDNSKLKEWKKFYFKLLGQKLTWHRDDNTDRSVGGVEMESADIQRPEEADGKKFVVRMKFGQPKGYECSLSFASDDEATSWFSALNGERLMMQYLLRCAGRVDLRLVAAFRVGKLSDLAFDNLALGEAEVDAIAGVARQRRHLLSLSLTNCKLSDANAKLLASKWKATVQTVDLSHNEIGTAGAVALAKAFANKKLGSFKISHNKLDASAAADLAAALNTVTTLDISHNKMLCDGGAKIYATIITPESKISEINLAECGVSDAGATILAELLSKQPLVRSVDLCCNDISDAGANVLAKAVHDAQVLMSLNLKNNKLSNAGAHSLAAATLGASSVRQLNLDGNKLDAAVSLPAGLTVTGLQTQK